MVIATEQNADGICVHLGQGNSKADEHRVLRNWYMTVAHSRQSLC